MQKKPMSDVPGEAFVDAFTDLTRTMMAQSRALSRKVSLMELLTHVDSDKENADVNLNSRSDYQKNLKDLSSIDVIVSDLERRVAEVQMVLEDEKVKIGDMENLRDTARRQATSIAYMNNNLPRHLPHAAGAEDGALNLAGVTGLEQPRNNSHDHNLAASESMPVAIRACSDAKEGKNGPRVSPSGSRQVPLIELVTVAEFESVPKSTRARLTIGQINAAVTEVQKAVEKRYILLSKPRSSLSEKLRRRYEELKQQRVAGHNGECFIAEADIRVLPSFKRGEVTSKALIATLRSLKRLRGVRGNGIMTYVVCSGKKCG